MGKKTISNMNENTSSVATLRTYIYDRSRKVVSAE